MPTPGAGINSIGVVYETTANDKVNAPAFGSTALLGFSISFELTAADRRYYETTSINGFGIEFEYSFLNVETIITHTN